MNEKTYTATEMTDMLGYVLKASPAMMIEDGVIDLDRVHALLYPEVQVVLVDAGPRRILVINTMREHLGWGLLDAKNATEHDEPYVLCTTSDRAFAHLFSTTLRNHGATVSVEGAN